MQEFKGEKIMKNLIIIGAGGHGKVVADIAKKSGNYQAISFLDDEETGEVMGIPVIGKSTDFERYISSSDFFVAIGDSQIRSEFMEKLLSLGAKIPTLIHPTATIGSNVEIGEGTSIMAGVVINPCTSIGKGVIVNTCSSVDHDCVVEDYCHIAVGVHVAGTVGIGKKVLIGAGATIKNNVKLCDDCVIGAGAVVVSDINETGTYVGVPAKLIEVGTK